MKSYRVATELERVFLRVVTRGYPDLESQIETCEIADYDPTGWCYVRVNGGQPSSIKYNVDGPLLEKLGQWSIETMLWTGVDGMLQAVEIVEYGTDIFPATNPPYVSFVDAATSIPPRIKYKANEA